MKIVIDRALCQGHGQCEGTAPALFRVAEDGLAVALKDAETAAEIVAAKEAIRRCPAVAIILGQSGTAREGGGTSWPASH